MGPHDYDYYLFDLDGTLVDIDPEYPRELIGRVGDRLGRDFSDAEVEALWYEFGHMRRACLRDRGIEPDRFWQAFHAEEDPLARAAATYLYDDASVIGELDGPVGLVTHCQQYLTDPVLDSLDIRDWFDTVVCCSEETGWKPDPRPVQLAKRDLGVAYNGHSGVFAGDSPNDVGAAWNAGLDAVHIERHDPVKRGRCVLGDYRVTRLTDLTD